MKRVSKALTALLLALVMTVTLLPVQVLAAESGTEERTFTGTYVNPAYAGRIAGTVQARTAMAAVAAEPKNAETVYTSVAEAAAALRRQMTARSNSMTVALYADSDDWQAVALRVWNTALDHVAGSGNTGDYLHWQYAGVSYSASYRASGTGYQYSLTYTPNPEAASTIWYTTAAQEQQLDGYIRGTILPQLALDGKTAYQKVQAIYGWITRNVSYDHDNLYDNSYLLKYTAYAAAVNRTAVCQGYANLFYRLANDAGLDCRIITGMANGGSGAEAHAWNIVRMEDGKYYCVDATWDAGRSSYRYFLKGLDAFKTDHTAMTDEKNSTYWTKYVGKVSATDYVPGSTAVVETPANVTMKSAAVSGSSIVVTWETAANAKTYIVYRKAAGETGWSIIAKSVSGTSYTDKSVTAGIPYTYTVRGVASDGKTMSAGYDTVGKTATVPAVPANVTMKSAAVSGSSIVVTWEAAENAKTYTIYRKAAGETGWSIIAKSVSGTSYTDKSVTAGIPYTYTARGVAADGRTMSAGYDGTGVTATVPAAGVLASGNCGPSGTDDSSITWKLTSDGVVTFTGKGSLGDYYTPWLRDDLIGHIKKVVIGSGITYVGSNLFYDCSNLTELTLPNTVQAIGIEAFSCTRLRDVVIPDSVTTIYDGAFRYCYEMETLSLGSGVTSIGPAAFERSTAKVTLSSKNTAFSLQNNVLFDRNKTTLVQCFNGDVATYTVPSTVKELGDYSFAGLDRLETVIIPNGVTRLGEGIFENCKALVKVDIPASVTEIGSEAFAFSGKARVSVAAGNTAYCSRDGALFTKNMDTLLHGGAATGHYTVPNGVVSIENGAFAEAAITGITFPSSLKYVGRIAFFGCTELTSLTIPSTVQALDGQAFAYCEKLTSVTIENGLQTLPYLVFQECRALETVVIPKSVTGIHDEAFLNCSALKTVVYGGTKAEWDKIEIGDGNEALTKAALRCTGVTTAVPANVTMKSAAVSGSSIVVTWEAAANAKTYIIYRKTKSTNWTVLVSGVSGTSYTDKSVTAGEPYTYTVRGVAADGRTMSAGYDAVGKTATVPAVPANVTMKSAAVSGSSIVVTWEAAANAKTYIIYRKTKSTNWTVLVSGVSGTSYTDKSVTAGEPYTYTVRGVAADGKTMSKGYDGTGKTATVPKPDSGVPANVTMKSAAVSGSSIVVTWEAAANAKTYIIYRKTKSTNWTVLVSGVSGTSYTDKSVTAGEPYTYTVRGVAADGKTMSKGYDGTGKTATVPKPDSGVPANVTMKSAAVSGTSIVVTWEAAENAKTYTIYRKTKSTNWTVLVSGVSGTSYTDKSVTAGEPYTYTVRGVAADGRTMSKGYDGTGKTATVPKPDSGVPANVTMKNAVVSGTSIVVTWEAAENAKTYTIYRKTKSTNWTVLVSGVSGTSYTDKSVAAGETYTYTVRGVAADGKTMSKGYDGTGKTAKVPDASAVPDPVTMVGAVADSTGITVTWKTAMGAAAYTIYRKTAGTNWTVLVSGVKGTSYVDNTALAKGTYTYTVRGVAADGRTMSPSYDRTGKTATMPETVVPANVKLGKATADAAGITVTWEAAANAKTYAIYRKTGSTSWTLLTTKASGTSYKDLTAARNQLYTYTVRGVAADGRTMSAGYDHTGVSARITASASTRPDRVKLQSAERLSDGILVTWEAAANARTYVVYRSKVVSGQATGWTAIARDVTNTYYKDIGGVSGTLYAYTVIGVAADGKTTSPSYHTYGVRATMP